MAVSPGCGRRVCDRDVVGGSYTIGMQERCPVSLHGDGPLNLHVSSNSTLQVRFDHDPHSVPGGRVEVLFSPTRDLGI